MATKSLPRLVLCGAKLLTRLVISVRQKLNISWNNIYLWTDSTIVISWLRKPPSHWTTSVANRVAAILDAGCIDRWQHVSTSEYPANLVIWLFPTNILANSQVWWTGPSWLLRKSHQWPSSSQIFDVTSLLEVRPIGIEFVCTHSTGDTRSATLPPLCLPMSIRRFLIRRNIPLFCQICLCGFVYAIPSPVNYIWWSHILDSLSPSTPATNCKCKTCVLQYQKAATQIIAALLQDRAKYSRAFSVTGVDFGGPFPIKLTKGLGIRLGKGYVAVFVCFAIKAIHLEHLNLLSRF